MNQKRDLAAEDTDEEELMGKSLFISHQTTSGREKLPIGSGMDGKNINKLPQFLHFIDYPFAATSNAALL